MMKEIWIVFWALQNHLKSNLDIAFLEVHSNQSIFPYIMQLNQSKSIKQGSLFASITPQSFLTLSYVMKTDGIDLNWYKVEVEVRELFIILPLLGYCSSKCKREKADWEKMCFGKQKR